MENDYLDTPDRLASLRACAILGTGREPAFDNIVFTAAQVMRAPVAMFGLFGQGQAWFKAKVAPPWLDGGIAETLCRVAVASGGTVVVDDMVSDARFGPQEKAPRLHFGAACPLIGPDAQRIGAVLVMDYRVRTASERQVICLRQLAAQGSELLQLRVPGIDVRRIGLMSLV